MNLEKLRFYIDRSGLKQQWLAEQLEISRGAFANKIMGKSEFRVNELLKLTELLNLSDNEKIDLLDN